MQKLLSSTIQQSLYLLIGLLSLTLPFSTIEAQNSAEVTGLLTNSENGEPIDAVHVFISSNKQVITFDYTQPDGTYTLKGFSPGTYDLNLQCMGFVPQTIEGVIVQADQMLVLDLEMKPTFIELPEPEIIAYRNPLITIGKNPPSLAMTDKDLGSLPSRSITGAIALSGGVYQGDEGDPIHVRGARSGSTIYYIDGVRSENSLGVPMNAVSQLLVMTGGIPAKYGDTTGGVIVITTK